MALVELNRYSPVEFDFDFTGFLTASDGTGTLNDSITTVTWTIPSGIHSYEQYNTTTVASIWIDSISGTGALNTQYILGISVVTANSQNLTINVPVVVTNVVKFPGTID
jgi:hypothetical protein